MITAGSAVEWVLVAAPAVGLACAVVVHLGVCQLRGGNRIVPTLLAGAVIGAIVMLGISLWGLRRIELLSWIDAISRVALNCLTYNAGFYLYSSLFIALSSSLRIEALRIVADSAAPIFPAALAALTDRSHLATGRLQRLVADGRLIVRGERYFCRPDWLLLVSRFYSPWRRVLFGVPYSAETRPPSPVTQAQSQTGV